MFPLLVYSITLEKWVLFQLMKQSIFVSMTLSVFHNFSVLTPHYMEEVKFSKKELHSSKEGVSISFYMQKIFPGCYLNQIKLLLHILSSSSHSTQLLLSYLRSDEWENFLERLGSENIDALDEDDEKEEELRDWASFRGQTLSRTGEF